MIWPITPILREQPVHFWVEALEASRTWSLPWDAWSATTEGFAPWQALEHRVLATLLQDKMAREHAFLQLSATVTTSPCRPSTRTGWRVFRCATWHPGWVSPTWRSRAFAAG